MRSFKMLLLLASLGLPGVALGEQVCFEVQGMTCATCPITVKAAVKKLAGVNSVKASLEEKSAAIDFDSKVIKADDIKKVINDVGYKATQQECKKKN